MLDKIKKIGRMQGILYERVVKKKHGKEAEQRRKTRAGTVLSSLRKELGYEQSKFMIHPTRTFVTIPAPGDIKIKNIMYPVIKPYAYISIRFNDAENVYEYFIVEPKLNEHEEKILAKMREGLVQIIDVSLADIKQHEKMIAFLEKGVQQLLTEYNFLLDEKEYVKIMYYIYRDFVGLNRIEAMMNDPYIEDIGCLPEHEKMFVMTDDKIKLIEIKELLELGEEIPEQSTIIKMPHKKMQVLSFNPDTMKVEYKSVTGLLRKENRYGYYLDIRTEGGNHINVSPDHPLLVLGKDGIAVKTAGSVKENEYLLRLKTLDTDTKTIAIDFIDELARINKNFRVKGANSLIKSNIDASKTLGVSNRLVALWKRSNSMPIWAYLKLEKDKPLRKSLKVSVGQGVKNWLPAIINPGEDFALFLGLFLAEGYYEDAGISFAFGKHEKELQEAVLNISRKLFGVTTSIIEHKTASVVYCGGKTLKILFKDILKVGNLSENKRIPEIAYSWDNDMLIGLVKGYFLGDGYIRISDKTKKAVMATASEELVLGIRYVLYRLGIFTRVDKRNRRFANTWEISIERGRPLQKFAEEILGQHTEGGRASGTELYPSFLFNSGDYTGVQKKMVYSSMTRNGKLGINFALYSTNRLLQKLINGDVHPVKIIDINPVKYEKPFYDIEVEDNKNFMHGDFIFTHNCDGLNTPVYAVHQKFGSIRTNVIYTDEQELREFVIKLAERSDRYISYAEPLLDGTLRDGSRVQASLAGDVTTRGPTFSIRKFKETPFTPTDMIRLNTVSEDILAYLWFVVENGSNILITGGVSTGKTSILNTISLFIPSEAKIISIEDTRELNLPHENWIPGVTRVGFAGSGLGEITMFELLRESFRQNPDYLVVGEVRGKEAYVMFQGMASGHPSISTMHAGGIDDVMKRLQTKPISLSPGLLDSLDIIIVMVHAREKGKSARRVKEISEIESIDTSTGAPRVNRAFVWMPASDSFGYKGNSWLLNKISREKGIPMSQIIKDISQRKKLLNWMYMQNIVDIKEIEKYIGLYGRSPDKIDQLISGTISKEEL